ncbi:unnamed protein product [Rhodiola kirilowii]
MSFTVSISNKSIPTLHQSTFLLWPLDNNISGAIYSVVPHKVFDRLDSSISFARSPAKILNGVFSNAASVFLKWLWLLKATNPQTGPPSIHSCRFLLL